jgi:hypothetical protein
MTVVKQLKKGSNSFMMKLNCAQEMYRHFLFDLQVIRNDEMQQIGYKVSRFD